MSTTPSITATIRTGKGKGAARRARREGQIPAVLYGHGTDPLHLTLPGHELLLALRTPNVLISLDIDGKTNELAIPKAVQRDPLKGFLEHVDLLLVKRGEKVVVDLPIQLVGDVVAGGQLAQTAVEISVETEATHIPESVTVSIAGLTAGDSVAAKDIALPSGVKLDVDGDTVVLQVLAAQAEEAAAEGEGEEAAEA